MAWCWMYTRSQREWGTALWCQLWLLRAQGACCLLRGSQKSKCWTLFSFFTFFIKVNILFISIKWKFTSWKQNGIKRIFEKWRVLQLSYFSVSYEILQAKLSCGVGRRKWPVAGRSHLLGCCFIRWMCLLWKIHQAVHLGLVHFSMYDILQ